MTAKPRVHVLGTGGSISAIGPHRFDYTLYPEVGKKLSASEMIERIPEVREFADVTGEDVLKVGSPAIGPVHWLQLAERIHALLGGPNPPAGIVITHGTATLEETAYFLHLTVKSDRPIVVTGAMRPPSAVGTDADLNLLDAIRLAASPEAVGRGVLTVLNNEIQSARDVTKDNAFRVNTFNSRDFGCLGFVDSDARVLFYRDVTRPHTTKTEFDIRGAKTLPRVDIVASYAGDDGLVMDAVLEKKKSEGLIMVGFGGGSYPPAFFQAGKRAAESGLPVVLATRSTTGRVISTPQKENAGIIVCDDLMPQKARILLTLALTKTKDRKAIQEMFYKY